MFCTQGHAAYLILLAILLGAVVVTLLWRLKRKGGADPEVTIQNFAFDPANVTVSAGDIVSWTNKDATSHTVTSSTGAFDSGVLAPGASFQKTFPSAGTFPYHCSIHPSMSGMVIVT